MGVMVVGGVVPANSTVATIVTVAYVISTGSDMATGLALAYPVGTVMGTLNSLWVQFQSLVEPWWQNFVDKGDIKSFCRWHLIFSYGLSNVINVTVLFLSLYFGVASLQLFIENIPQFVMKGITSSSGLMTSIGLGITLSLIWTKELGGFFFIGFLLFKCVGMSQLQVSIFAVAAACIYFFIDQRLVQASKAPAKKNGGDFF